MPRFLAIKARFVTGRRDSAGLVFILTEKSKNEFASFRAIFESDLDYIASVPLRQPSVEYFEEFRRYFNERATSLKVYDSQKLRAGISKKLNGTALQYIFDLWDQPEVSVVLSGMSTMQHVIENVASAGVSAISSLTEDELLLVDEIREKYRELSPIPCTKCDYCMPCPNGVNIPRNFEIYNEGFMYDKIDSARQAYNNWFAEDQRANNCIECLECEEKCPQKILISEWLPKVHQALSITS